MLTCQRFTLSKRHPPRQKLVKRAIAAPGQSEQYHLLLDIINAPHREAVRATHTAAERLHPFTHLQDPASVRWRAIAALNRGWRGDAEAKAVFLRAVIGVPEQDIPPDPANDVRSHAIIALNGGWSGDAEAKPALLRAAIGVPGQQILPDPASDVRYHAIIALGRGWSGDSEAKAALLRAVIGVISRRPPYIAPLARRMLDRSGVL